MEGHKWRHRPFPRRIPKMLPWQAWRHSQERDEKTDCSLGSQETSNTKECGITEQIALHHTARVYFAKHLWKDEVPWHSWLGGHAGRGRGPAAPGCNPPHIGMCEWHKYLQRLSLPQVSKAEDTRLNYKQVTWDMLKAELVLEYPVRFSPSS